MPVGFIITIGLMLMFLGIFLFSKRGAHNPGYYYNLIVSSILIAMLGFGLYGLTTTSKTTYKDVSTIKVSKLKTCLILEDTVLGTHEVWTDLKSYNTINDSTKFQYKTAYDQYGNSFNTNLMVK